jgi:hypothetical protein
MPLSRSVIQVGFVISHATKVFRRIVIAAPAAWRRDRKLARIGPQLGPDKARRARIAILNECVIANSLIELIGGLVAQWKPVPLESNNIFPHLPAGAHSPISAALNFCLACADKERGMLDLHRPEWLIEEDAMQYGSLIWAARSRGGPVWEYRWREPGPDGIRKHRRIVVGPVSQFEKERMLCVQSQLYSSISIMLGSGK